MIIALSRFYKYTDEKIRQILSTSVSTSLPSINGGHKGNYEFFEATSKFYTETRPNIS